MASNTEKFSLEDRRRFAKMYLQTLVHPLSAKMEQAVCMIFELDKLIIRDIVRQLRRVCCSLYVEVDSLGGEKSKK